MNYTNKQVHATQRLLPSQTVDPCYPVTIHGKLACIDYPLGVIYLWYISKGVRIYSHPFNIGYTNATFQ